MGEITIENVGPCVFDDSYGLDFAAGLANHYHGAWKSANGRSPEETTFRFKPNSNDDLERARQDYRIVAAENGLWIAREGAIIVGQLSVKRHIRLDHDGTRGLIEQVARHAEILLLPQRTGRLYTNIESIAVSQEFRRRGIASDMLRAALAGRRDAEPVTARIHADNPHARSLFVKYGFSPSPLHQMPEGTQEFGPDSRPAYLLHYQAPSVRSVLGLLGSQIYTQ